MHHQIPRCRRGLRASFEDLLADLAVTAAIDELDSTGPAELEAFLTFADDLMLDLAPPESLRAA